MSHRATFVIKPELEEFVNQHRAELGLPADASASSIHGRIWEVGLRTLWEDHQREERVATYRAWAGDPEQAEAAAEAIAAAEEAGYL